MIFRFLKFQISDFMAQLARQNETEWLKSRFESRVCMKLSSRGRRLVDCPVFLFHCDWDMCYVSYVLQTATCDYNLQLWIAARSQEMVAVKSSLTKAASAIQSACEKVGHKDDSEMSEEEKLLFRRKHLWQPVFSPTPVQSALVWLLVVDLWIWDFWIWNWNRLEKTLDELDV